MPENIRVDAVLSSASIPVVFPAQNIGNYTLVDGGVFSNLNLAETIHKCRDFGFDDSDIIVDIILCYNNAVEIKQYSLAEAKYMNSYQLLVRKSELQKFYGIYEDITRVVRGFPKVNFRHLIAPSENLGATFVFDGPEKINEMMTKGHRDATESILIYNEKVCSV